jgi:anti-sigma regulatory factor (Ser/Thr protein kinase)
VIEALVRAVGDLRTGASALKAENADLRSERRRLHQTPADAEPAGGIAVEEHVSLGVNAPAMARRVVAAALGGRVAAPVVENAKLAVSELVTNSVCHGGVPAGGLAVLRLQLSDERLRLEVEDPGRGGDVVRGRAGARACGGFGLQVVETLSERWGSERRATGALRVWAELSLTPTAATAPATEPRTEVHVMPSTRAGTWGVHLDADAPAVSEHASRTEAETAARAQAVLHRSERIIVRDRYFRTHFTPVREDR